MRWCNIYRRLGLRRASSSSVPRGRMRGKGGCQGDLTEESDEDNSDVKWSCSRVGRRGWWSHGGDGGSSELAQRVAPAFCGSPARGRRQDWPVGPVRQRLRRKAARARWSSRVAREGCGSDSDLLHVDHTIFNGRCDRGGSDSVHLVGSVETKGPGRCNSAEPEVDFSLTTAKQVWPRL